MVEVKRKDGESAESLIRRFSRRVQHSGLLLQAKKVKFRQRIKSKRLLREDTLRRKKIREQKEYLKKIGRLDETQEKKFGKKKYGSRNKR